MPDVRVAASPRAAQEVATRDGGAWVWLVDGSGITDERTLETLLAAAERVPEAALLASAVHTGEGVAAEDHAPLLPRAPDLIALDTAVLRVLHVRATTGASVLVRATAAAATPAPPGCGAAAALAWTARLLRARQGFLVPESVVTATRRTPFARRAAALLVEDGLGRGERLRLALDAAERVVRAG